MSDIENTIQTIQNPDTKGFSLDEKNTLTYEKSVETAGGTVSVEFKGRNIDVPAVTGQLISSMNEIKSGNLSTGTVFGFASMAANFLPGIGPIAGPVLGVIGSLFGGGGKSETQVLTEQMNAQFNKVNLKLDQMSLQIDNGFLETAKKIAEGTAQTALKIGEAVADILSNLKVGNAEQTIELMENTNKNFDEQNINEARAFYRAGVLSEIMNTNYIEKMTDYANETAEMLKDIYAESAVEIQEFIDNNTQEINDFYDKYKDQFNNEILMRLVNGAENELEKQLAGQGMVFPVQSTSKPQNMIAQQGEEKDNKWWLWIIIIIALGGTGTTIALLSENKNDTDKKRN